MLKKFKDFLNEQADQIKNLMVLGTSEEALTNYYKCNDCGNIFYLFNEQTNSCKKCQSNNVSSISDFEYFADLKKSADKKTFMDEYRKKGKRENDILDMTELDKFNKMRRYSRSIN